MNVHLRIARVLGVLAVLAVLTGMMVLSCSTSRVHLEGDSARVIGGDLSRPLRSIRVPSSYRGTDPSPLLLVLHGYGSTGEAHLSMFDLGEFFERDRVIVAAPDGLADSQGNQFWNAVPSCCDFEKRGPSDVAYLASVIRDLSAKYSIDKKRVYVVGHSNGGAMALRLACEVPELIAAVTSLAGPFYAEVNACSPRSLPPAVQLIHGTRDRVVPIGGGHLSVGPIDAPATPAIGLVADRFATLLREHGAGCDGELQEVSRVDVDAKIEGSEGVILRPAKCAGIELVRVLGMGHGISKPTAAFRTLVWGFLSTKTR
jgi:polyhydroxybutyrate depolymerase